MQWIVIRDSNDDTVTVVVHATRTEAAAVCADLVTGDDSTLASKMAFRAFMTAADGRDPMSAGST
jgi:hypothetical protein